MMKKFTKSLLVFTFSLASIFIFAQSDCEVIKPGIDKNYTGKCKKGLAHGKGIASGDDRYEGHFKKGVPEGKGTYTWSTGEVYVGEWQGGFRHGEGIYTYKVGEIENVLAGSWMFDQYTGEVVPKPKVIRQVYIDKYKLRKLGDIKNRVLVDLYQNGSRNTAATNFFFTGSSGYETNVSLSRGYEGIIFPATFLVKYTTWNKLRTYQYNAVFEIEISEPGDWRLELIN